MTGKKAVAIFTFSSSESPHQSGWAHKLKFHRTERERAVTFHGALLKEGRRNKKARKQGQTEQVADSVLNRMLLWRLST